MNRPILALLIAAATVAGPSIAARAQDRTGVEPKAVIKTDTPAETAGKPAADTRDPGKTATEAVTNPAAVPPTEGAVGSGKPPAATPPATGR
ncbi:hypothetical protein [Methylobacterium sp. SI9]|uniref:hypothetical protein n=1 Tax=Methylobacterium guangdongense TaxID=3138811 RepID=UPI00313DFE1A